MMSYKQDYEINKINFNKEGLEKIQNEYFLTERWPIVYILNDNGVEKAYVGETIDTKERMLAHLDSKDKRDLAEALFISSKKFNKSATLDIESNLIRFLHADGKYKLLNGNLGLVDHSYYKRNEFYNKLFKNIWNSLVSKGIAQHSLEHITNSDLFKYSPYKTLSGDQKNNLLLIIDELISGKSKSILIEGSAGTGKTILAIFLFKLLLTPTETFNYKEFGELELQFINKIKQLKKKYPNPKMALVIAMSSFRKTIQNVFKNIEGLSNEMVIGPSDIAKNKYDILLVDEAHRLRQRKNLTNYRSFDDAARLLGLEPNNTNELEWTQMQSEQCLYFYDPKQSIKPTDVDENVFTELKDREDSKVIQLLSQFRSKGGNGYVDFVNKLLDQKFEKDEVKYYDEKFDVLLFKNFSEFVSEIREKNNEHQLCRFVAGYGWEWISKNDKTKYDIIIDGIEFQWNKTNIDYITSDENAEQIGCIHTTQGYDLNYIGIIFGPEIIYNPDTEEIEVVWDKYYDRNGRNTITDINVLKAYIINIYKTMMLRGILGCYIYAYDENLRNYFEKHIHLYNENTDNKENEEQETAELIPFENAVPFYSLEVAAGDFFLNESFPNQEL